MFSRHRDYAEGNALEDSYKNKFANSAAGAYAESARTNVSSGSLRAQDMRVVPRFQDRQIHIAATSASVRAGVATRSEASKAAVAALHWAE